MTPQAPSQTVEDLGKLVKSKYPGTYDSLSDVDVGTKVKAKYPDAYGHFTDIQEKPKPPESTFSKLKGTIYDPTIGSIGQGARDAYGELTDPVNKSGGIIKGAHEMISGAEKAASPLAISAAIMNPEVTLPAMALGYAGQKAGEYIPKALGASEDVSNLIGDIAGLVAGGSGAKAGPRISPAIKGAYQGFTKTPLKSPFIRGYIGEQIGGAISPELRGPGFTVGVLSNKLMGAAKGAGEAFKSGKTSPQEIVAPPGKGPSIGQLKTAVKNGTITTDQFNAAVDKMTDLNPEAKELHKADAVSSLNQKVPIKFSVTSPKTLSLGDLKSLVKIGRLSPDEFQGRLSQLGYNEEDSNHLTELLKKQIEDEKGEDEEGEENKTEEKPKTPKKTGPGQVKSPKVNTELKTPISDEELQKKIDSHLGQVKSPLENQIVEPNLTAPVQPPPGHEAFLETETPYKPPITEKQIEDSQSDARSAKETTLARHFIKNDTDLDNIPRTSEYLKAIGNEAGLKRTPSLQTLENAINRAKQIKTEKPGIFGSERGSFSLKDKVVNKPSKLTKTDLEREYDKKFENTPKVNDPTLNKMSAGNILGKHGFEYNKTDWEGDWYSHPDKGLMLIPSDIGDSEEANQFHHKTMSSPWYRDNISKLTDYLNKLNKP